MANHNSKRPLARAQEEILKEHADSARRRKEAAEAAATPEERVALYAAKKQEAKQLQKQEVRGSLSHFRQPRRGANGFPI
jgi:hypothetical protein